jgi:hypothetical protein
MLIAGMNRHTIDQHCVRLIHQHQYARKRLPDAQHPDRMRRHDVVIVHSHGLRLAPHTGQIFGIGGIGERRYYLGIARRRSTYADLLIVRDHFSAPHSRH